LLGKKYYEANDNGGKYPSWDSLIISGHSLSNPCINNAQYNRKEADAKLQGIEKEVKRVEGMKSPSNS
jgi:hypothetical protein